jgi:alpha-D-ribose 1-methylphosphonate 5-triphosphate synthase subunit PhnI
MLGSAYDFLNRILEFGALNEFEMSGGQHRDDEIRTRHPLIISALTTRTGFMRVPSEAR